MVSFKVVIGTKEGKCLQKEVGEPDANAFLGKKVGDKITGEMLGFTGYEFEITGGSDYAGFPMRSDIPGVGRKRILAVQGIGLKKIAKGLRVRKTVCGNTIHPKISQINLKVTKAGSAPLPMPEPKPKEAKAEKKEEKK
jgi:small subunit ribosomal protein S6e